MTNAARASTWHRRAATALLTLLVVGVVASGALAANLTANLVREVDTSGWPGPDLSDPTGITEIALGKYLVVGINTVTASTSGWVYDVASDSATNRGTGVVEPTGVDYHAATNRLFITTDRNDTITIVSNFDAPGESRLVLDAEDEIGATDTEDPAYDASADVLYFLSGSNATIYSVDPEDGNFANGAQWREAYDLSRLNSDADWEGMAWHPTSRNLLVADRYELVIYELNPRADFSVVNQIDASNVPGLEEITGMAVGRSSFNPSNLSIWVTDRETHNIFELSTTAPPPTPPVAFNVGPVNVPFGGSASITLTATDANGDNLTYEYTQPGKGTVTGAGPNVTYTHNGAASGNDSFQFRAKDGSTWSNWATVTINIPSQTQPNRAPQFQPVQPFNIDEQEPFETDIKAVDPDGHQVTYSKVGTWPDGVTLNAATGRISWTPTELQGPGQYDLRIRATDNVTPASERRSSEMTFRVNVSEVNRPPVIQPVQDRVSGAGDSVAFQLTATDPDRPVNDLRWSATGLPPGLSISSSGRISGTIAAGAGRAAPYIVTVRVTDDGTPEKFAETSFLWRVPAGNHSPTIDPIGPLSAEVGQVLSFKVTASDPDGDSLLFTLVDGPQGATISADGNFTWQPTTPGIFEVTVKVIDRPGSLGLSDTESFTVTVTKKTSNTPPPQPEQSTGLFGDDDSSPFEADIEWLANAGITRGCNPPSNTRFCPDDFVTRGQMAAFLVRALGYGGTGGGNPFSDDDGHVFESDIARLAAAGVTRGCNPPRNDRFCPDQPVTRGQMAAFLVRALGYGDGTRRDLFRDDDGHVFEADIDALAAAGVTRGCNPPANDRYCPDDYVTRGQMAAFLHRALGD
jgi:hypothetical protein